MRKLTLFLGALLIALPAITRAAAPVVTVTDAAGASARVAAPVSLEVDIETLLGSGAAAKGLQLVEVTEGTAAQAAIPAQFVPAADGATKGTLWWLMPPGEKGERRFRLGIGEKPAAEKVSARYDADREAVDVTDGQSPVLRYNYGTVPPPPEIVEKYEKQTNPPECYARGHYIHPLYGPDGEPVSDDYSLDHPHHRGICWAWPFVYYGNESRNIWAIRMPASGAYGAGGIWARPAAMHRVVSGPILALVDAECDWKWGDTEPIVKDRVVIRAFRNTEGAGFLDVEIELVALVDGVALGGQKDAGYGGFNLRTFPSFDQRKIDMRIDPADAQPRRAWYHLTGNFPSGKGMAGVAMLEDVANPDYPNWPKASSSDLTPGSYPPWRSVQPAWPGDRRVELPKGKPLVLKYRLWIHPGLSDEATLADLWQSYAQPAKASISQ
ncbi:MAG: DUF6807 family protein [Patescibacteria group bacterium]|nr:DUF6807 family protein [Patescibacteria group bacterium]